MEATTNVSNQISKLETKINIFENKLNNFKLNLENLHKELPAAIKLINEQILIYDIFYKKSNETTRLYKKLIKICFSNIYLNGFLIPWTACFKHDVKVDLRTYPFIKDCNEVYVEKLCKKHRKEVRTYIIKYFNIMLLSKSKRKNKPENKYKQFVSAILLKRFFEINQIKLSNCSELFDNNKNNIKNNVKKPKLFTLQHLAFKEITKMIDEYNEFFSPYNVIFFSFYRSLYFTKKNYLDRTTFLYFLNKKDSSWSLLLKFLEFMKCDDSNYKKLIYNNSKHILENESNNKKLKTNVKSNNNYIVNNNKNNVNITPQLKQNLTNTKSLNLTNTKSLNKQIPNLIDIDKEKRSRNVSFSDFHKEEIFNKILNDYETKLIELKANNIKTLNKKIIEIFKKYFLKYHNFDVDVKKQVEMGKQKNEKKIKIITFKFLRKTDSRLVLPINSKSFVKKIIINENETIFLNFSDEYVETLKNDDAQQQKPNDLTLNLNNKIGENLKNKSKINKNMQNDLNINTASVVSGSSSKIKLKNDSLQYSNISSSNNNEKKTYSLVTNIMSNSISTRPLLTDSGKKSVEWDKLYSCYSGIENDNVEQNNFLSPESILNTIKRKQNESNGDLSNKKRLSNGFVDDSAQDSGTSNFQLSNIPFLNETGDDFVIIDQFEMNFPTETTSNQSQQNTNQKSANSEGNNDLLNNDPFLSCFTDIGDF